MSGIMDRVHVWKRNDVWYVEGTGFQKMYVLKGTIPIEAIMVEAQTLHDNPQAFIPNSVKLFEDTCPICTRFRPTWLGVQVD